MSKTSWQEAYDRVMNLLDPQVHDGGAVTYREVPSLDVWSRFYDWLICVGLEYGWLHLDIDDED